MQLNRAIKDPMQLVGFVDRYEKAHGYGPSPKHVADVFAVTLDQLGYTIRELEYQGFIRRTYNQILVIRVG